MAIENYPIGWAIDAGKAEPVMAYLIDLPGIAMQGRSFAEAVAKLKVFAPVVLATYRKEGISLPTPSAEPYLSVGAMQLQLFEAVTGAPSTAPAAVQLGANIQLAPA